MRFTSYLESFRSVIIENWSLSDNLSWHLSEVPFEYEFDVLEVSEVPFLFLQSLIFINVFLPFFVTFSRIMLHIHPIIQIIPLMTRKPKIGISIPSNLLLHLGNSTFLNIRTSGRILASPLTRWVSGCGILWISATVTRYPTPKWYTLVARAAITVSLVSDLDHSFVATVLLNLFRAKLLNSSDAVVPSFYHLSFYFWIKHLKTKLVAVIRAQNMWPK